MTLGALKAEVLVMPEGLVALITDLSFLQLHDLGDARKVAEVTLFDLDEARARLRLDVEGVAAPAVLSSLLVIRPPEVRHVLSVGELLLGRAMVLGVRALGSEERRHSSGKGAELVHGQHVSTKRPRHGLRLRPDETESCARLREQEGSDDQPPPPPLRGRSNRSRGGLVGARHVRRCTTQHR